MIDMKTGQIMANSIGYHAMRLGVIQSAEKG
jgi:hypothetical protein